MGNTLDFILKLTDMLTPAMRSAAGVSDSAAQRIQRDFDNVNRSSRTMVSSVNELRDRLTALNQVRFSTRIVSEFNNATREAQRLERQIDRLEGRGQRSGGGMGIGGLLAGVGAYGALKGTLGASAEREQQKISFGVLTGSQKQGDQMLGDIVKMGAATPFENEDLIKAAQTMKLFGIENKAVLPNLQMLGDVAGGNAEKLQSLSLAYSQVTSAGRLQGQDLLQLINAGFNPLQEISKATGMSMADLKDKMESGAISADMVTKAFQRATGPGGQFYQMMEKQSQTLAGRWSTFMDNGKAKLLALGDVLMPVASSLLDFGSALLAGEGPALAIAVAIGGVALAVWGGTIATSAWAGAQAILNAVMNANPIILIISLLVALGIWIYSICKKYEGWGKSMQGLWEIIKGFVKLTGIAFKDMGETIWYHVQFVWLKTKGFFEWISGAMGNVWKAFQLAAQFKFGEAKQALTAEIKVSATKDIENLEKSHKAGQTANQAAAMGAMNQMAAGYGMIGLTKKVGGAGKAVSPVTANGGGAMGAGAFGALTGDGADGKGGKSKADGINSGGQRSIVINIAKQTGAENIYVMSGNEAANEIEDKVRAAMRKVLYSMNGVATN